jgi:hypothetical protein
LGSLGLLSSSDDRVGREILGVRLLEGRRADPSRPDEVTISPLVAERHGIEVGDRLRAHVGEEVACDDPSTWGEGHELTVVGIGFTAIEIPAKAGAQYLQNLHATPAFAEQAPDRGLPAFLLVLEAGTTPAELQATEGVPAFDVVLELADFAGPIEEGLASDANALWVLALIVAIAALCVIGPATGRHRWELAEGDRQLSAIGWARGERVARSAANALAIWLAAAAVAVGVAILASTSSPVGDARSIEPGSSVEVDGPVLILGLVGLALVVAAALVLPAIVVRARGSRARRTPLAGALADLGFGPAPVMGVRLGIEPDRRQVPVRSAILATSLGVATVVGALVYTASAQHLRETPAERGVVWDDFVYVADRPDGIELVEEVRGWPEVEQAGPAGYFTRGIEVGPIAREARVMAFGDAPSDIEPRVIAGRAPEGDGEIVLNPKLAEALDLTLGDTTEVVLSTVGAPPEEVEALGEPPRRTFEVVGTAAVPIGDGAFPVATGMTMDGYLSLLPDALRAPAEGRADFVLIRRSDDTSTDEIAARLAAIDIAYVPVEGAMSEALLDNILTVDRTGTESVPDLLGWLMLLTGAGVLAYGLTTTLSRGRHELAIVRAVGFDRRLVRRTSRWVGFSQATAALVLGVPLGVMAGRHAWRLYARSLGVAEVDRVPVLELVALAGGTVLVSVVVAVLVARWVVRRAPGAVLRTLD